VGVVDELHHLRGHLGGARPRRLEELVDHRLQVAVQAEALQHRESERSEGHDGEQRGVHEAHRAQVEVAVP